MFFFLMIRRPPRSTLDRSSAASDVYKRQQYIGIRTDISDRKRMESELSEQLHLVEELIDAIPVSYTHLRAHETVLDLVCRLLLEKKKHITLYIIPNI